MWDQELGANGGIRLEEPTKSTKASKAPKAPKSAAPKASPRAPVCRSEHEIARLAGNRAIQASKAASEGATRHFFWKHRAKFAPFGAVIPEPTAKDVPGEDMGADAFPQPPYISVAMRDYQREGLRFLVQSYANGVSAILGDEMGTSRVGSSRLRPIV